MGKSGRSVLGPRAGWSDSPCSEDHGRQQGREASPCSVSKVGGHFPGHRGRVAGAPRPALLSLPVDPWAQTFLGWGPVRVSPVPGRPSQGQVFMTQDETLVFMSQDEAERQEDTAWASPPGPPLSALPLTSLLPRSFLISSSFLSSLFLFFLQSLHLLNLQ